MNAYRIMEIFLYQLVDLIPNLLLAFLPFRNHLRFSKRTTAGIAFLLYVMLSISRILALSTVRIAAIFTFLWIAVYLAFYRLSIQADFTKLLFVLLNLLNYGSFTAIIYSAIVYHNIDTGKFIPYSLFTSMVMLLVLLVTWPLMAIIMEQKLCPLMGQGENKKVWRYLWMVPATFCFSYYYNLYSNGGIVTFSKSATNVVFAVLFNAGGIFVTYLVIRLVEESNANLRLKSENYLLSLTTLQYEHLKQRMEETKRARHDFRQNLTVLQSLIRDRDYDRLQEYLKHYLHTLPPDSPVVYCSNYTLNAVIVYYESVARERGIQFNASVEYPINTDLSDPDMVVLFGNLLENALEACSEVHSNAPCISMNVRFREPALVIAMDNTYHGTIKRENEAFLTTKKNHSGIGLSSVDRIAKKYNGIARFNYDNEFFHSSILLYP